jgi:hypothetical protein
MVLTNNTAWAADGVGVENVTSYGVGLYTVASEFRRGAVDVVTGNTTYLLQALDWIEGRTERRQRQSTGTSSDLDQPHSQREPSDPLILTIETLLDADDGLNNRGVQMIQDTALQRMKEQQDYFSSVSSSWVTSAAAAARTAAKGPPSLDGTWWFLCGTDHIEWHNRDIFKLSSEEFQEVGVTSGLTGLRSSPFFCTSAGFTRVGLTPSNMTFPKDAYSNHALAFYFPKCTDVEELSTTPAANVSMAHCWRREFPGRPFILKSRSITSDSMDHMNPKEADDYRDVPWLNKTDHPLLINETENTWDILINDFSIDRRAAWTTSLYLYNNRVKILMQNKQSRCAPGFPCYRAAKKNLIFMQRYWMRQEKGNGDPNMGSSQGSARRAAIDELQAHLKERKERALELAANHTNNQRYADALAKLLQKTSNNNADGKLDKSMARAQEILDRVRQGKNQNPKKNDLK